MSPDKTNLIDRFSLLLRVRFAEEELACRYVEQEMRTPTHFGTGQEAVAVGVCAARQQGDLVYTHHRSHNHYLACGGDVYQLAAELYGRTDGCSQGRGGSVHLTALDRGFAVSSAILAETIATATGSALGFKMDGRPSVAVCFFGDGALDEGAAYESFNFAAINKLPVLYVCENNLYATESPMAVRRADGSEFCDRLRSFKIDAVQLDGNDLDEVFNTASHAFSQCRSGHGPFFMECMTYRWREHVGPLFDHEAGRTYRSKDEFDAWQAKCPVARYEKKLLTQGVLSASELQQIKDNVRSEVSSAIDAARNAEWPKPADLFLNA